MSVVSKLLSKLSDSFDEALDEVIESKIQQHLDKGLLEMRLEKGVDALNNDYIISQFSSATVNSITSSMNAFNACKVFQESSSDINKFNNVIVATSKYILNSTYHLFLITTVIQIYSLLLTITPTPTIDSINTIITYVITAINNTRLVITNSINVYNIRNTKNNNSVRSLINSMANKIVTSFQTILSSNGYSKYVTSFTNVLSLCILGLFSTQQNNVDIAFAVSKAVNNSLNASNPKPNISIITSAVNATISAVNNNTDIVTAITNVLNNANPRLDDNTINSVSKFANYAKLVANSTKYMQITFNIIKNASNNQTSANDIYNAVGNAYLQTGYLSDYEIYYNRLSSNIISVVTNAIQQSRNNAATSASNALASFAAVGPDVATILSNVSNAYQSNYNIIQNKNFTSQNANNQLSNLYFDMPFSIILIGEMKSQILRLLLSKIPNPSEIEQNNINSIISNIENNYFVLFHYYYTENIFYALYSVQSADTTMTEFYGMKYTFISDGIKIMFDSKGKNTTQTISALTALRNSYNKNINDEQKQFLANAFAFDKFITVTNVIDGLATNIIRSITSQQLLSNITKTDLTTALTSALTSAFDSTAKSVIDNVAAIQNTIYTKATDLYNIINPFITAYNAATTAYNAATTVSNAATNASNAATTVSNAATTAYNTSVFDAFNAEFEAAKYETYARTVANNAQKVRQIVDSSNELETIIYSNKLKNLIDAILVVKYMERTTINYANDYLNASTFDMFFDTIKNIKEYIDTILSTTYILYFSNNVDNNPNNNLLQAYTLYFSNNVNNNVNNSVNNTTIFNILKKINISMLYYNDIMLYQNSNVSVNNLTPIYTSFKNSLTQLKNTIYSLPKDI